MLWPFFCLQDSWANHDVSFIITLTQKLNFQASVVDPSFSDIMDPTDMITIIVQQACQASVLFTSTFFPATVIFNLGEAGCSLLFLF